MIMPHMTERASSSFRFAPKELKRRASIACRECRSSKTKCIREVSHGLTSICNRCSAFGLECTYHSKKRGRRPNAARISLDNACSSGSYDTNIQSRGESANPPNCPFRSHVVEFAFAPKGRGQIALSPERLQDILQIVSKQLQRKERCYPSSVMANQWHHRSSQRLLEYAGRPLPSSPSSFVGDKEEILNQTRWLLHFDYCDLVAKEPVTFRQTLRPLPDFSSLLVGASGGRELGYTAGSLSSSTSNVIDAEELFHDSACAIDLPEDDPIEHGYITLTAARALFHLFVTQMSTWANIFDPKLHTFEFVRARSALLFTSVLAVACRFSPSPLEAKRTMEVSRSYPNGFGCSPLGEDDPGNDEDDDDDDGEAPFLRSQGQRCAEVLHVAAQNLAARAFVDGDRSVECCQSLYILYAWGSLSDGVSFIQSGFAYRLGFDLELDAEVPDIGSCAKSSGERAHLTSLDTNVTTVHSALSRGFRNRQRTFLLLFLVDKAQQIVNSIRPHAISPYNKLVQSAEEWYKLPGATPSDSRMCALVAVRVLQAKYMDLIESASASHIDHILDAFGHDMSAWEKTWLAILLPSTAAIDSPSSASSNTEETASRYMVRFWCESVRLLIASHILKVQISPLNDSQQVNIQSMASYWVCQDGARGMIKALASLPSIRLRTAPIPTLIQLCHAAVLLCSAVTISRPRFSPAYVQELLELFASTIKSLERASWQPDDTVVHIAAYYRSLIPFLESFMPVPLNTSPHMTTHSRPLSDPHALVSDDLYCPPQASLPPGWDDFLKLLG